MPNQIDDDELALYRYDGRMIGAADVCRFGQDAVGLIKDIVHQLVHECAASIKRSAADADIDNRRAFSALVAPAVACPRDELAVVREEKRLQGPQNVEVL
jgi:hypothetical protein